MFYGYDPKVNAYAFTDADVAADWRNGLLRAAARTLVERGSAHGTRHGSWGSFAGFEAGSLAEHLYSAPENKGMFGSPTTSGHGTCAIVSVTDLREDSDERYEHNSFGDGRTYNDSTLSGTVTCEHGVSGGMTLSVSLGELIGTIADSMS